MFVLDVSLLIAGYMYILKYYKLVDIQLLYSSVFFLIWDLRNTKVLHNGRREFSGNIYLHYDKLFSLYV